jgi:undecaprenyl-diphosphatase
LPFSNNKKHAWLATIFLILFFLLEILVVSGNSLIQTFDTTIQNIFMDITSTSLTNISKLFTKLGSPTMNIIYMTIIILLFIKNKFLKEALWTASLLIGGNLIALVIKYSVRRQRPTDKLLPASGYSFPSGHTFGTALLILTIIILVLPHLKNLILKNLLKVLLIIWLILVALSRIYLRGHFPTDVIGSMLLAGVCWEYAELIYLHIINSKKKR